MNKQDAAKIVTAITVSYRGHFKGITKAELQALVDTWAMLTADYTYEQINVGLLAFMANDTKGFPPVPGQIIGHICNMADSTMSAIEAWCLVRKAIGNGYYGAEEEFKKLPPLVQKAVGGPSNLRNAAAMDLSAVESVEKSNFLKAYKAVVEREREIAKIPANVRGLISGASQGMIA